MRPEKSLVICTLPRSGSYMLCDGLAQTGVLGYPAEYYNESNRLYYERLIGRQRAQDYNIVFDYIMRIGTTPNGFFTTKVLFHQLATLKASFTLSDAYVGLPPMQILEHLLPDPHYIYLVRRDKLQQAISYHRAISSGIWWRFDERQTMQEATVPEYNHAEIRRWLLTMQQWEAAWPQLLAGLRGKTLTLYYDEIVADYTGTMQRVHDFAGLVPPPELPSIQPELKRQSDGSTAAWANRFLETEREPRHARGEAALL